ncbi:hypothetical protein SAY86_008895, partial [Trapa natans]
HPHVSYALFNGRDEESLHMHQQDLMLAFMSSDVLDVPSDTNTTGKLLCTERHLPVELCLKVMGSDWIHGILTSWALEFKVSKIKLDDQSVARDEDLAFLVSNHRLQTSQDTRTETEPAGKESRHRKTGSGGPQSRRRRDQEMADWGPVVIAVVLFVLLSPGLLFQLPGKGRVVEFGNMQTSGPSILVHTIIFFCLITIFLIALGVHIYTG